MKGLSLSTVALAFAVACPSPSASWAAGAIAWAPVVHPRGAQRMNWAKRSLEHPGPRTTIGSDAPVAAPEPAPEPLRTFDADAAAPPSDGKEGPVSQGPRIIYIGRGEEAPPRIVGPRIVYGDEAQPYANGPRIVYGDDPPSSGGLRVLYGDPPR